jgi:hypothetical protein
MSPCGAAKSALHQSPFAPEIPNEAWLREPLRPMPSPFASEYDHV